MNGQAPNAAELIELALRLGPAIRACRGEIEAGRRLPAALLASMHEARLFKPTFARIPAVSRPRIAHQTGLGNGKSRSLAGTSPSNRSLTGARPVKRAVLPASRRTFAVVGLSHLA